MTNTFLQESLLMYFAIPGKSRESRNCGTSLSATNRHIVSHSTLLMVVGVKDMSYIMK